jgi:predicted transcriptional regulator
MIDTATLTVRIPKTVFDGLEALAKQTGRDIDDLAVEAVGAYLDWQQREQAATAEAVAAAKAGAPRIPHEKVAAWLRSWGTPDELPRPE